MNPSALSAWLDALRLGTMLVSSDHEGEVMLVARDGDELFVSPNPWALSSVESAQAVLDGSYTAKRASTDGLTVERADPGSLSPSDWPHDQLEDVVLQILFEDRVRHYIEVADRKLNGQDIAGCVTGENDGLDLWDYETGSGAHLEGLRVYLDEQAGGSGALGLQVSGEGGLVFESDEGRWETGFHKPLKLTRTAAEGWTVEDWAGHELYPRFGGPELGPREHGQFDWAFRRLTELVLDPALADVEALLRASDRS